MAKRIAKSEIANIGRAEFRYRMMHDVVAHVSKHGRLHVPLLTLVTCFIDGLARGKPGKTKEAYLRYLKRYFPELCADLGAEVFYEKYRNAAVHEFSIKRGYGIERNSAMRGRYADTVEVRRSGRPIVRLNIDRLVDNFLDHIRKLKRRVKKKNFRAT